MHKSVSLNAIPTTVAAKILHPHPMYVRALLTKALSGMSESIRWAFSIPACRSAHTLCKVVLQRLGQLVVCVHCMTTQVTNVTAKEMQCLTQAVSHVGSAEDDDCAQYCLMITIPLMCRGLKLIVSGLNPKP